jgi:hypothetical protein
MELTHTHDHRFGLPYLIWHGDPQFESNVRHIIDSIRPSSIVETGTHMGWTAAWFAENYPNIQVYTVEVLEYYFKLACENLAKFSNVHSYRDTSPHFLQNILPVLRDQTVLYWLDAHWVTDESPIEPLVQECKLIASMNDKYACLIDDFYCYNPDFVGDTFENGTKRVDLSYVSEFLGPTCACPSYPALAGYRGYGLFLKGMSIDLPLSMKQYTP